ncbi:Cytidylate kinase-like family protein [Malonomonas rubra DSM 5091]|uniref:Cytidylate kinase-like family protein n=1 Tax=Malonomonas rubra DSM 5091 TaxID=1122189 RepID=A0A1M6C512_MALRU|nr:cytidylate kinase-like family protein [Malonomonas rubra]SHI56052.1 Cytidylate kinase-like family protein [Malonomonas rubra DSM 5091]
MANRDFWTPQQEAKLLAWHQIQQIADAKKPAPCFTVARDFGCQAYPLAEELVKRLNARVAGEPWVVIGREILDEVARLSGFSVEQIEKSQDTPNSLKAIFSMFLDSSLAEETEVFAHMRNVIRSFAKRGNCVLVGRGAVFAAAGLPNCIHLRLVAPYEFRVNKIMKSHGLSEAEAKDFIELHQKQRADFIKRFSGHEQPDDPVLYHMVLNNGLFSIVEMAEMIEEHMIKL